MDWSKYQREIFTAVATTQDSLVIEAVAGSGKTTTIVEAIRHVPPSQSVLFCAFNKAIADTLKGRVTSPNATCATLHSLGLRSWQGFCGGGVRVEGRKSWEIAKEMLTWEQRRDGQLVKLVGLAKQHGIVPGGRLRLKGRFLLAGGLLGQSGGLRDSQEATNASYRTPAGISTGLVSLSDLPEGVEGCVARGLVDDTDAVWEALCDTYDIDSNEVDLGLARQLLKESLIQGPEVVDYDDMISLPVICNAPFPVYDVVFLDEAQDVSQIQGEMVSRLIKGGGRVIAVGDRAQCQPPGTLITTQGNQSVPIEDIKIGQEVVSYRNRPQTFIGRTDTKNRVYSAHITAKSKRYYYGDLYEVTAGGRTSRATLEHKWPVRFNSEAVKKSCVYLMCRGDWWRVGSCKIKYRGRGCGPTTRLWHERGDHLWILSVHATYAEAFMQEAIVAATYGLPQIVFEAGSRTYGNVCERPDLLKRIFDTVPDQLLKAFRCLKDHKRSIKHPFLSNGRTGAGNGSRFEVKGRQTFLCPSANLMPEIMSLLTYSGRRRGKWEPLQVRHSHYSGDVYSLKVEKHEVYVADGLLTHNSIYAFRGADSTAMDKIAERFNCRPLPLSISYRCPKAVVRKAQTWVAQIEPAPDAPEGLVVEELESWGLRQFKPSDVVLCRLTRPLVALAFRLIRARIACRVLGRDIGQGLIKLIEKAKLGDVSYLRNFSQWLDGYEQREVEKLKRGEEWAKIGLLRDKCETVRIFVADLGEGASVIQLKQEIEYLFKDLDKGSGLTLSTIHKFKGQEAPRVFVLDADKYMPPEWATDLGQERNLCYVACTRSQAELYYLSSERLRNSKED